MLSSVQLRQVSAFGDARLEFGPGINVLIGANGSGKSHAMKLAYGVLRTLGDARSPLPLESRLVDRLVGLFLPDDDNIGRIVRRRAGGRAGVGGGNNRGNVTIEHARGTVEFSLHTKGKQRLRVAEGDDGHEAHPVVFLPPREVLSLGPGFLDLAKDYNVPFDQTYSEAVAALSRPTVRASASRFASIQAQLTSALGGDVLEDGGRFYVKLSAGARLEAPLMGEGLRKIASLMRLIQNGTLATGSTLFWDEPEANLNPILTRAVADVIIGLATAGVQVVMVTHDYFLASRISMSRPGSNKRPDVRFIGLSAPETESGAVLETKDGVAVEEGTSLEDLSNALLVQALVEHADAEQEAAVERFFR